MSEMITCGGCDNRWTGKNRTHCSTCHVTLGGVTAWNRHRVSDKCVHPSKLGLKQNEQGVWISDAES